MSNSTWTDPVDRPRGADALISRLEEAGRTLLALPTAGPSPRLAQSGMDWIRDASDTYAPTKTKLRPAIPSAFAITRMDEALAWIPLIPQDKYVLRRIVGARSLVSPLNDRHLFTWRRLGVAIGADHKAVQRWHAQGVELILAALRQLTRPAPSSAGQHPTRLPQPSAHHRGPDA